MNIKAPMDVYSSRMDIPFGMAAYARGHKFAVEVVNLRRALTAVSERELALKAAEDDLDGALERYRAALAALHAKMERDPL